METREEKLAAWADTLDQKLQGLRFLEGWFSPKSHDPNKRLRITDRRIQYHEIACALLDDEQSTESNDTESESWRFKVISFPRLQEGRLTLSFPRELFRAIQDRWHLHPRTIEVFLSNNGILNTFTSISERRTSLLFKVSSSRSTGFDCASVTCGQPSRTTYVLYHHLQDEDSIFEALLATPERCYDPHFFIAAVYRSHDQNIELQRSRIDDAVRDIERQTGFGHPRKLLGQRRPSLDGYPCITDLRSVVRQLSYPQTELAIVANVARCCITCGDWLKQAIDEIDQSKTRLSPASTEMRSLIREDVEYSRRRTEMLLSQVQAVKDRAQSQTNFILNSIAQSDAEYTAAIAIDGKRDSIAVKTISVLGIVFLPGTFMATLFDVGMFDWKGTDSEGHPSLRVSPSMWIYWAATLPLTAVTILAWLLWSWKEMSRTSKRLMTHRVLAPKGSSSTAADSAPGELLPEKMV